MKKILEWLHCRIRDGFAFFRPRTGLDRLIPDETLIAHLSPGARLLVADDIVIDSPWGSEAFKKPIHGNFSYFECENERTINKGAVLRITSIVLYDDFHSYRFESEQPHLDRSLQLMLSESEAALPITVRDFRKLTGHCLADSLDK